MKINRLRIKRVKKLIYISSIIIRFGLPPSTREGSSMTYFRYYFLAFFNPFYFYVPTSKTMINKSMSLFLSKNISPPFLREGIRLGSHKKIKIRELSNLKIEEGGYQEIKRYSLYKRL